jgi:hypothetical protein
MHRGIAQNVGKIPEPGVCLRAKRFYQQLDLLQPVRQQARRDLLTESRKHHAVKLFRQIPSIGPIRGNLLVAQLQTPHRFRTKRQLWAYRGFALKTHDSGEYRLCQRETASASASSVCSASCSSTVSAPAASGASVSPPPTADMAWRSHPTC